MKVKIKDYDYEIIEVEKDSTLLKQEEDRVTFGQTDFENQKIYLNKDVTPIRLKKTLIHELTHAFAEAYGFSERLFDEEELCLFSEAYLEDIISICSEYFKRGSESSTILNNPINSPKEKEAKAFINPITTITNKSNEEIIEEISKAMEQVNSGMIGGSG